MTKPTDDHHTQNPWAGVFEPFEALPRDIQTPVLTSRNLSRLLTPWRSAFSRLSQAGKIFGKSPARCAGGPNGPRSYGPNRQFALRHRGRIQRLQNGGEG